MRLVYDERLGEYVEPTKPANRFIQRIPLRWLDAALDLSPPAVRAALACWYMDGCCKGGVFTLSRATCRLFHLNVWDKRRGLRQLLEAGLIRVERREGRANLITVVRGPPGTDRDTDGEHT
jgi:DNA-binding transcriptional ArsR family regulator